MAEDAPTIAVPLSEAEQRRLDQLLETARKFHNFGLIASAIVLGLTAVDANKTISLPLGVQVPVRDAIVVTFLLAIGFTLPSLVMMRESTEWAKLDPRRPPFPWFPLVAVRQFSMGSVVWLFAPVVLASVGMMFVQSWRALGIVLVVGVGGLATPLELPSIIKELSTKTSDKGEPLTFTWWLIRLGGGIFKTTLLGGGICIFLAQVPRWKNAFTIASGCFVLFALMGLFLALLVPLFHRPLNRFGNRKLGFVLKVPDRK